MVIAQEKTSLATSLFSADSHVIEPPQIWQGIVAQEFWGPRPNDRPGGTDPELRCGEMDVDGVIGEVLYPTYGLSVFGIDDASIQFEACHAYNEWLKQYCSVAPERLVGVGMIPTFDADQAVREIRWCKDAGFRGIVIWETPHPDLPLRSQHYDPVWSEAARLRMPISFHILSGFVKHAKANSPLDRTRRSVNLRLMDAMDTLLEVTYSGVFERFPELEVVFVENEIGWLPFAASQWDYYSQKPSQNAKEIIDLSSSPMSKKPSEYIRENVYATFFRDELSAMIFKNWSADNFMWSNDYPHPNSTWPHSREFVDEQLAGLPEDMLYKVLRGNAEKLYGFLPTI